MIFRMEQQWVLLPLLVCQNGNCPPESSGAAVNELNDSSERERGGGEAKSWTDGRTTRVRKSGVLRHCPGLPGDYRVTTQ